MVNIFHLLTLFSLISCFSPVAYGKEATAFPWLITRYKYEHLSAEQIQIYQNAYFETVLFLFYNHSDPNNANAIKHLNSWTDCVQETKGLEKWTPRIRWALGDDLDKSAAYILHKVMSPIICENYSDNTKTKLKVLRLYNHDEWYNWPIKSKEVYLSGYIDTIATFFMLLSDAGMDSDLPGLQKVIGLIGINGILSETMKIKFERQYPLPWSISRGLGAARNKAFAE